MTKKKTYKTKTEDIKVNEPLAAYGTKRITFSTVETQNDIQLKYAMDITPIERLKLMRKLNDYAFKNNKPENFLSRPTKLIFTSYEYFSGIKLKNCEKNDELTFLF